MRRRILIAMLGTLAAALLLTGTATLVLGRLDARAQTEARLRSQASGISALVGADPGLGTRAQSRFDRRANLSRAVRSFRLSGITFVLVRPDGSLRGRLPQGLDPSLLDTAPLLRGETLSGHQGDVVYAMAPTVSGQETVVAVLTRQVDTSPAPALRWFIPAAIVTMLIGAAVALWVSRALTRPLRAAEAATHQIAAGDLSARVPVELGIAKDELGDLSRSINTMAENLERSRALDQQFLMSVSHDLRTPLTSIRGFAEAIVDGTATDSVAAASVVLGESRRLERLVRDLLDLARLDARQFSLDLQPLPIGSVVAAAADGFGREAAEALIDLRVGQDPSGGVAVADPDRLAQVVANLVENALKYATSWVEVATSTDDNLVMVTVTDDGPGIAAEDRGHVFERLYVTRQRPARKESGAGLGLAIVWQLVEAMDATVSCESPIADDRGTRMTIHLDRVGRRV